MHPRVLASRAGEAQSRTQAAAEKLAAAHGLEASLTAALAVYDRDPDTRAVMRQEAVADLLEALVEKQEAGEEAKAETESLRAEVKRLNGEVERLNAVLNAPKEVGPFTIDDPTFTEQPQALLASLGPPPPSVVEAPLPTLRLRQEPPKVKKG